MTNTTTAIPINISTSPFTPSLINPISRLYPPPALALSATSCCLSIVSALVIFLTYWRLPEIRTFTRKLMVCLTVADTITSSAYLVSAVQYMMDTEKGTVYGPHICLAQSILTTYSSMVSFFFTVILALHIFLTVVYSDERTKTTGWLLGFNLVSWFIPAVITVAAWMQGVLGEDLNNIGATGPWCWVKPIYETKYITWMFVSGKGWEIACYVLTMTFYVLVKVHLFLTRRRFPSLQPNLQPEDRNYLYVWLALYLVRIWGTVRFFMIVAYKSETDHPTMRILLYLQAIGDPAQAFCNFWFFCVLDKQIKRQLCDIICRRTASEEEIGILNTSQSTETFKFLRSLYSRFVRD